MKILFSYHFPCQMASEELTSATKPQEQKQRHFFLSRCAHVSMYVCSFGEEHQLMDEGTGMFFYTLARIWL